MLWTAFAEDHMPGTTTLTSDDLEKCGFKIDLLIIVAKYDGNYIAKKLHGTFARHVVCIKADYAEFENVSSVRTLLTRSIPNLFCQLLTQASLAVDDAVTRILGPDSTEPGVTVTPYYGTGKEIKRRGPTPAANHVAVRAFDPTPVDCSKEFSSTRTDTNAVAPHVGAGRSADQEDADGAFGDHVGAETDAETLFDLPRSDPEVGLDVAFLPAVAQLVSTLAEPNHAYVDANGVCRASDCMRIVVVENKNAGELPHEAVRTIVATALSTFLHQRGRFDKVCAPCIPLSPRALSALFARAPIPAPCHTYVASPVCVFRAALLVQADG